MTAKRAFVSLVCVSAVYLAVLIWLDSRNHLFQSLTSIVPVLPAMLGLALASYCVRYARWCWLLHRAGYRVGLLSGYLAYTTGFAFTVTPGKVGELVRIRYFLRMGVPASLVVSAFVVERACDLLVLLGLSVFVVQRSDFLVTAVAFVGLFLSLLALVAVRPTLLNKFVQVLFCWGLRRGAMLVQTLQAGLLGGRIWMTPVDILVCATLGIFAWTLTAYAFVVLLVQMGVAIPLLPSLSIYPLSMLVGAASMLPGGIGSTEAAIVAILAAFSVPISAGVVCAVGIRVSSIWFAVLSGFVAMAVLEPTRASTEELA